MDSQNQPAQSPALSVSKALYEDPNFPAAYRQIYLQVPLWCLDRPAGRPLRTPYPGGIDSTGVLDLLICKAGKAALGISFSTEAAGVLDLPGLHVLRIQPSESTISSAAAAILDVLQAHAEDVLLRPFLPWDGGIYLTDPAETENRLQRLQLIRGGKPTQFGAACGICRQIHPDGVRWVFHPACRSLVQSMLLGLGLAKPADAVPLEVRRARLAAGLPTDDTARAALARAYGDLLHLDGNQLCARHPDADPKDLEQSAADALRLLHLPAPTAPPVLWDLLHLLHQLRLRYPTGGDNVHIAFDNLILPLLRCFLPLNTSGNGITFATTPPEPKAAPVSPLEGDGLVPLEQRLRRFHQASEDIRAFSDMPLLSYASALSAYTGTLYPLWLTRARIWQRPIRRSDTVGKAAAAAQAMILQEFQEEFLLEEDGIQDPQLKTDVPLPPGRQMAYDLLAEFLFPCPDLLG